MSGVEVAGLVLGAIPLLVEGFKIYANSVSTVDRYRKYKNNLQDLARELDSEYVTYQNTCEQLLDGLVERPSQKADLLENPGGNGWKDAKLEEKLQGRLMRSYDSYMRIMEDMEGSVEKIKAFLKLGPDGKVQLDGSNKFREEYHKLKFSIKKKDYDGLIARITRNNEKLSKLTEQNRSLESSRCATLRKIPDFGTVQTYASHLYNLLSTSLKCGCPTTHSISLRLDYRKRYGSARPSREPNSAPPFRVVVSYSSKKPPPAKTPWVIEALDVRPIVSKPPVQRLRRSVTFAVQTQSSLLSTVDSVLKYENLLPIKNLCHTIPRIQSVSQDGCVGVLEDELAKHKMAVFQTSCFIARPKAPSLLSLHSIISNNHVGNEPFSWSDKLRVAVVLASSLLQLHRTPWLSEKWSKEDISFLEGIDTDGDILDRLFISSTCNESSPNCSLGNSESSLPISDGIRSRPLFALGVLLIELCIGRPFERVREEKMGCNPIDPSSSALVDFALADQLVETCYLERGLHYGDAVRRCIRCAFDTRRTDLDDAQFRQAVYEGVVAPLEEDLENFGGLSMSI